MKVNAIIEVQDGVILDGVKKALETLGAVKSIEEITKEEDKKETEEEGVGDKENGELSDEEAEANQEEE